MNNEADRYSSLEGGKVSLSRRLEGSNLCLHHVKYKGGLWIFDYLKIYNKNIRILYKQVGFGNDDTVGRSSLQATDLHSWGREMMLLRAPLVCCP